MYIQRVLWAAFDRAIAQLPGGADQARVLVACSGGLDSVVLLDVAVARLGEARVMVGHVDHGVRPDSPEDAAFVAQVAERAGVASATRRLQPPATDEATLRELRYAALEALRVESGAEFVFLAHHRDDQAETVLMRVLREGRLAGMPQIRGPWVRPLLGVPRRALLAHARRRGLSWREDPSNADLGFLRNRIRRELMPLLESRYRPGIARRLARSAEPFASRSGHPAGGNRPEGRSTPPPGSPQAPAKAEHLAPEVRWVLRSHANEPPPASPRRVWFDAESVPELGLRTPRPGDRIQPFGMSGRKKVSDVFQEHRVPRDLRLRYPLLVAGEEVLWVPGLLRSAVGAIRPETRARWEIWSNWE